MARDSAGQKSGPSAGALGPEFTQRSAGGRDRHEADVGSQSADSIKFCFSNFGSDVRARFSDLAFGSPANISPMHLH